MHWGKLETDQQPRGPGANEAEERVQGQPADPRTSVIGCGFFVVEVKIDRWGSAGGGGRGGRWEGVEEMDSEQRGRAEWQNRLIEWKILLSFHDIKSCC